MKDCCRPIDVLIIGGGMIVNDLILPAVYHLQRTGLVGAVDICATRNVRLRDLMRSEVLGTAFPGQGFTPHPSLDRPADAAYPQLYKEVLANTRPHNAVIVALPDPLHYPVAMEALEHDQHVLCVKPLVLEYAQARDLERVGKERGLFIGVEYHKRFDRRALLAKRHYAEGHFGTFAIGEAKMIEPYFYRRSNFQNWFTWDQTDPFVYVGCHYVDLVCFITGLRPAAVTVHGVKGRFPNGNEGYIWANGRVVFENGAILSVTDGLGYPDDGAGSNEQCLSMFCEGDGKTALIKHDDQFRGVSHSYLDGIGCAGSTFNYINPDFYQLVPWEGRGLRPIGYGFDSIAANLGAIHRLVNEAFGLDEQASLTKRRAFLDRVDAQGLIATPGNSWYNELVIEAARLSILHEGEVVSILYGDLPHVEVRQA